nr:DUF2785 domain-containing protein [Jeotgalibacillus terrae]
MEVCADQLFYKIGEDQSDSVFTRSFSALVVAVLISYDSTAAILSEEDFKQAFLKSHTYLRNEKDTRGFVEEKGWAHSIAHGADLLGACVSHPMFESEDIGEVLITLQACLFKKATFIDDEDERLALVIESLIVKYMDDKTIRNWLSKVVASLDSVFEREGFSNQYFRTKFNVLNFLKTLYFRLDVQGGTALSKDYIAENLHRFHQQVYG